MTTFDVQVPGQAKQTIEVGTSFYSSAAAAVPAILAIEDFPVTVKIWVESLQPDYPPLTYWIESAGAAARLVLTQLGAGTA